jgi:hypothetical protein
MFAFTLLAAVRKHLLLEAHQRCRDIFRLTSWGCVSAIDSNGRTIWITDAHRDDEKRFIVRADEKLTAFLGTGNRRNALSANCLDKLARFSADSASLNGFESGGALFPR